MAIDIGYDVTPALNTKNIKVIFVNSAETSRAIEDAVLRADEKYRFTTNKVFLKRKPGGGWRRNKKRIHSILKKTVTIKNEGIEALKDYAEQMEISWYLDRYPIALSSGQMERVSFLYEALNRERHAMLYNDCYYVDTDTELKDKSNIIDMAKLITALDPYEFDGFDLIWITNMRPKTFFEQMGEMAYDGWWFTYYKAVCNWGDTVGKLYLQDLKEMRRQLKSGQDAENCPTQPMPQAPKPQMELDPEGSYLRVIKVEHHGSGAWSVYAAQEKGRTFSALSHYQSQRTGMHYHREYGGTVMLASIYKIMDDDISFILDYYREHTEYHSDPRVQEILHGTRDFDRGPVSFCSGTYMPYVGEYDWKKNPGDPSLCDLQVGDKLMLMTYKK